MTNASEARMNFQPRGSPRWKGRRNKGIAIAGGGARCCCKQINFSHRGIKILSDTGEYKTETLLRGGRTCLFTEITSGFNGRPSSTSFTPRLPQDPLSRFPFSFRHPHSLSIRETLLASSLPWREQSFRFIFFYNNKKQWRNNYTSFGNIIFIVRIVYIWEAKVNQFYFFNTSSV